MEGAEPKASVILWLCAIFAVNFAPENQALETWYELIFWCSLICSYILDLLGRAPDQIDLGCIGVILKLFAVRCSHKLSWNWMTTKRWVSKDAAVLGFVGMRVHVSPWQVLTQSTGRITALQERVIIPFEMRCSRISRIIAGLLSSAAFGEWDSAWFGWRRSWKQCRNWMDHTV